MKVYKHVVMWKFKELHNGLTAEQNALWIKEHLEDLVGKIPGLLSAKVGMNASSGQDYDAILISSFTNPDALAAYKVHPLHKVISEHCKEARLSRTAFDWWEEE